MQVLDLPKSKLSLHRDEMVKYASGDAVVARYPTSGILGIELEKTRQIGFPIVLSAVFLALAFVSYRFVESPGWSWTGVIVSLGICGLVVLSTEGRDLVIETTTGTVRYPVADLFEEAEGFVVSANALLAIGGVERSEMGETEEKDLAPSTPPAPS